MINPICDKCKEELVDFGGILLSPPDDNRMVTKIHLCKNCYEVINYLINVHEVT